MDLSHAVVVTWDRGPADYKNSAEKDFGEPPTTQVKPPLKNSCPSSHGKRLLNLFERFDYSWKCNVQ